MFLFCIFCNVNTRKVALNKITLYQICEKKKTNKTEIFVPIALFKNILNIMNASRSYFIQFVASYI